LSFLSCAGNPELFKAAWEGGTKLFSKAVEAFNEFVPGTAVGDVLSVTADIFEGSTQQAFGSRSEDISEVKQNAEKATAPPKSKYNIEFKNDTDINILISGYGVSDVLIPRIWEGSNKKRAYVKMIPTDDPNRIWTNYVNPINLDNKIVVVDGGPRKVTFRDRKELYGHYIDEIEETEAKTSLLPTDENKEEFDKNSIIISQNYKTQTREFIEQTNTNMRQLVPAGSIPINFRQNSSLSSDTIVAYIMSKSPLMSRPDIERLINTYIQEAQEKGINYEIAIAQMCYASKFLKNRRLIINYDYANVNNGKSFRNMSEGIHSHIQHLYNINSTHEDSLKTWAEKNILYVRNIIIILYEMNAYTE
jgi:hypothetical protein